MVKVLKIKTLRAALLIVAAAFLIAGPAAHDCPASEDAVIQPGTGVGALKLGISLDVAYNKIGQRKADSARQVVKAGISKEIWLTYNDMGITLVINPEKTLERIIVTSSGLLVERNGLRVGSSAADVEKSYGVAEKKTALEGDGELWSYPSLGISFTINKNEKRVDVITIMSK
jgi:hypothetical protein